MLRQAYFPTRNADQVLWLENFVNKLSLYQATLGITATQFSGALADAYWLVYVLGSWLPAARATGPTFTQDAIAAQTGDGLAMCALSGFTAPPLPPAVVPVKTGALNRIFALVQSFKGMAGYTDAIGSDLRVVGPQHTAPDLTLVQPVISVKLNAAQVDITWGWGGNGAFLDMLEIQVDRGSGYALLAFDTTPNYTDTAPFPAAPAKWKYKAIYHAGDQQVGHWSAEASVMLGG